MRYLFFLLVLKLSLVNCGGSYEDIESIEQRTSIFNLQHTTRKHKN